MVNLKCEIHKTNMKCTGYKKGRTLWACKKCEQDKRWREKHTAQIIILLSIIVLYTLVLAGNVYAIDTNNGLISYWTFNDNYGFNDTLGINNGTGNDTAQITNNGKIGKGLLLDGTGDYIDVGVGSNIQSISAFNGTRPFSISMWINASSLSATPQLIGNVNESLNQGYSIRMTTTAANLDLVKYNVVSQPQAFPSPLTAKKWYHLVIVQDTTEVRYFLDGINFANNSNSGAIIESNYSTWIGSTRAGDAQAFNGIIDEVSFWNRSLSSGDVIDLYNEGKGMDFPSSFNLIYNATTYETAIEGFAINSTFNSSVYSSISANLVYNGTSYPATRVGTGNSLYFFRTLSMPIITDSTTKSFYWNITLSNSTATVYNVSGINSQTINPITFSLCNSTNTVPYINITFQDESTLTSVNGSIASSTWIYYLGDGSITKTLLYVNSSVNNPNYAFCFSPGSKTLHKSVDLQYSYTNYPQRRWTDSLDLTNITTNKILYLLSSSVGIYSIYSVQNQFGSPISGVSVTAERLINGVYILVEQGTTDNSGAVTFWLNPNFDHRLTFIKSGFPSQVVIIRPSSSNYVVTMSDASQTSGNYNSSLEGLTWIYYTNSTTTNLLSNTMYKFTANFTSNFSNIIGCKMELLDNNSLILSSTTGCTSVGGSISIDQNTGTNPNIRMKLSIDIGSGYQVIDTDAYWAIMQLDIPTRGTIMSFILHSRDLSQWGEGNRGEFSRILLYFIILFCVLAWVSANTNYDFITSGGVIIILMPVIWISSIAGFFNLTYLPDTRYFPIVGYVGAFMNKYTIALLASCFSLGYWFNNQAAKGG